MERKKMMRNWLSLPLSMKEMQEWMMKRQSRMMMKGSKVVGDDLDH